MHRLVALVVLVTARLARAQACPPAVALAGEPALVEVVRGALAARGIASDPPGCPALHARLDRRGAQVAVVTAGADGAPIERVVGEPATAATVIESWTRSDVGAPLLATHAVPRDDDARALVAVAAPAPAPSGTQLFAAAETSFASDATVWQGVQLGACVMLGPICATARAHVGKVIAWPDDRSGFSRKGAELYGGIDVPLRLGRDRLTLGFAAGYGSMFTRHLGDAREMGVETSGPRAEAHAALAIPLSPRLALELAATGELTQATGIELHSAPDPTVVFPGEARSLLRLAVGVRYGAL